MSQWSEYYKGRVGWSYPEYCIRKYGRFLQELLGGGTIREEGCGIGSITKALLMLGCNSEITCFDKDPDQVALAKVNLNSDKPYVGDIFSNHGRVDIIFSHGVLEHFSDDAIKKILERQKSEAKKVVHYIPSDQYLSCSFGDERLLSEGYWREKFRPKEIISFNAGKDLIGVW